MRIIISHSMPTQFSPFFSHLLTTLEHRPYVFAFLICFLIFGTLQLGFKRTWGFLILGWIIAFASEVSSIRNGFPYGNYQYVYENLRGELLLWGVPLWDSLSYTFLAYASFSTAVLITLPFARGGMGWGRASHDSEDSKPLPPPNPLLAKEGGTSSADIFFNTRTSFKVLFLSSFLMMGIDVIIDPLTALGDQWFLGRIYYYPEGGIYFGVPLSNFLGWALVAFCIVFLFQRFDVFLHRRGRVVQPEQWKGLRAGLGAALYLGVFFFNWGITVWLKEWSLVIADLILVSPLLWIVARKLRSRPLPLPSNWANGKVESPPPA